MKKIDQLLYAILFCLVIALLWLGVDNYFAEQRLHDMYDAYNDMLIQEALQ